MDGVSLTPPGGSKIPPDTSNWNNGRLNSTGHVGASFDGRPQLLSASNSSASASFISVRATSRLLSNVGRLSLRRSLCPDGEKTYQVMILTWYAYFSSVNDR